MLLKRLQITTLNIDAEGVLEEAVGKEDSLNDLPVAVWTFKFV
jgi:hypothetical protein